MTRKVLLTFIFAVAVNAAFAQSAPRNTSPLAATDAVIAALAGDIAGKLNAERAQKVAVAQFTFRDTLPPFSLYWTNHLTEELAKIPGRSFTLLSGGNADWFILGEITEIPGAVRVYTRIVRSRDRAVMAGFHSDFELNEYIAEMLSAGNGASAFIARDAWEPDSWDNAAPVELGESESSPVMNRTVHSGGDEDYFLIVPAVDGRLAVETTGGIDTYMYLYDADTREELDHNDDGASNYNARIRRNVRAGKRYLAVVKGYDEETGSYGFRAYLSAAVSVARDEYESDDESSSAKPLALGTRQQHTFHDGDDIDWIKFDVSQNGRFVIRARGITSTRLDTHIELFDSSLDAIDEDDDGGEDYDSRLSVSLDRGLYYLKITCLDDEPEEPYTVSVEAE